MLRIITCSVSYIQSEVNVTVQKLRYKLQTTFTVVKSIWQISFYYSLFLKKVIIMLLQNKFGSCLDTSLAA